MSKTRFNDVWRVLLIYMLVLLFAGAVVMRIVFLQIAEREQLMEKAREMDFRMDTVEPVRGNVFSKNGTLLAATIPVFDVYFDYSTVNEDTLNRWMGPLTDSLSAMFRDHSKAYFEDLLRKGRKTNNKHLYIAKRLRLNEYNRLKTFPVFRKRRFQNGIGIDVKLIRERPYGDLAMRTIGYVRKIEGKMVMKGIEGQFDTCLRGKPGYQVYRRVNEGQYITVASPLNVEPVNGSDVYTSIDIEIQDVAEEALRKCLIDNEAAEGCVVMMDVQSGLIEVMANLRYNYKTKEYEESYNFAVGSMVEPGSTFKAITMTAVLENNPNFSVKRVLNMGNTAQKVFHNKVMKDSHVVKNGTPTVEEAFWESSNIAFAMLTTEAFENNPQRFIDLIYATKIQEPLHLDLKGEEGNPDIKSVKDRRWSKLSLPWMSIGYEVMVTPMTMLTYYNAIANNGRMVKPQFVREIRRGKDVVMTYDTIVINERIASERTIRTLQGLLRGVVENGTAKALNDCVVPVSGKTGTAQISGGKKKGYDKKNYTASFVGYFPSDKPKYTCVVMISRPMGGKYYGASVAAPVFKDIVNKVYATSWGIKEETNNYAENCEKYTKASMAYYQDVVDYCGLTGIRMVDEELGTEWVSISQSNNGGVKFTNISLTDDEVPNLAGMNVMDAVYLIESMGWKAEFSGRGVVESQSVKAGTKLEKGKTISLKLKI